MIMYGTEEWARAGEFPKALCIREYRKHGLDERDLIADLGDHETYHGADVLDALGY